MRARAADWVMLWVLAVVWGTSLLFIKLGVQSLPPLSVAAGRIVLAALLLLAVVCVRGLRLPTQPRAWVTLVALGLTGNAIPFFAISWGEQYIPSALAGILLAFMPLVTLVLAHAFVPGERISWFKAGGFVLGFAGVLALTGVDALWSIGSVPAQILGQLAVLLGAFCYAVNAVIARFAPPESPLVLSAASLLVAALALTPLAVISDASSWSRATAVSIGATIWLGVISTALAMLVFFRLIASAGPTFFSYINFLIPLIAVSAGVLVLGETVDARALLAFALVLGGLWLSRR